MAENFYLGTHMECTRSITFILLTTVYYKMRQILLQNATAILLQNAAEFITKCVRFFITIYDSFIIKCFKLTPSKYYFNFVDVVIIMTLKALCYNMKNSKPCYLTGADPELILGCCKIL